MSDAQPVDALFESVATIFAMTVLADHRTRDEELIEFTHASMLHNQLLRPNTILTRRRLLQWFETNKDEIDASMHGDAAEDYKRRILSSVTDEVLQRSVLSSIFTISVCDYELHDEESDFIATALKVWDTSMPRPHEVDLVA